MRSLRPRLLPHPEAPNKRKSDQKARLNYSRHSFNSRVAWAELNIEPGVGQAEKPPAWLTAKHQCIGTLTVPAITLLSVSHHCQYPRRSPVPTLNLVTPGLSNKRADFATSNDGSLHRCRQARASEAFRRGCEPGIPGALSELVRGG